MKVEKTCQNILETDCQWLSKSFNTSRFSFSRIFLIQTEKDYRFISANLLDRIVAFCGTFFGRTYESSFAKKLNVNSVKILDRQTYDLEFQKAKEKGEQILAPAVAPKVDFAAAVEAGRNAARRDILRDRLRVDLDAYQPKFTQEQRACAGNVVEAILTKEGGAVSLEVTLSADAQAEVMDYLVRKEIIAAWSHGGNRIYVKGLAGDAVDGQLEWRDLQALENERKFQERNRIGFHHQEQIENLQQSPLGREELIHLSRIILQLNTRGKYGPHQLVESANGTERCLKYLKDQQMICGYRQEQGKWIVEVSAKDQNQQPLLDVPPSFVNKQRDALAVILGKLSANRQINYPWATFSLDKLTPEMIRQVMDYLLLQGMIAGWHKTYGGADVTTDPKQVALYAIGHWRELAEAQKVKEFQDSHQIKIFSRHLEALEQSNLDRNQLVALEQLVQHLNSRINSGDCLYSSQTGLELAGLNFLKSNNLIHDFEEKVVENQGIRNIQYTIYVTRHDNWRAF